MDVSNLFVLLSAGRDARLAIGMRYRKLLVFTNIRGAVAFY